MFCKLKWGEGDILLRVYSIPCKLAKMHRFVYVTRIYDTSDSVSQYLLGSFSAFQTEKAGVTPFLES